MITIDLAHYTDCPAKEKYRTEHQLGLLLLSGGLKERFGLFISPEELPEKLTKNDYGKPFLKDAPHIHFNISHCDGLVACAIAPEPIGIDIEKIHPFRDSILRKVLTPDEKAFLDTFREMPDRYTEVFYRFWTLKECRIKQSGMGLSMPLTDFSFQLDLSSEPPKILCSEEKLYFAQRRIREDYFLSVCYGREIEGVAIRWPHIA